MQNLSQRQIIIIGGGLLLVILIGVIVFLNIRQPNTAVQAKLSVWGTDPPRAMNDLINAYEAANKGSQISYTQVDPGQYQTKLLAALAAGTGPDVFEIGNRDLPQWQDVLAPLPVAQSGNSFNLNSLAAYFPNVAAQDFVSAGQIYGLPLSIDTLAMIYNKDMYDSAGIAVLPKTWNDFLNDVPKLRTLNPQGQITRAAAALGGGTISIPNAPDLLSLLMLQNGTQMTDKNFSSATFAGNGDTAAPGLGAFNFYLQFANAQSPYYTWNDSFGDARTAFTQGKVATIFDYASALSDIKNKAPFLNVGVAPMLQPASATIMINYPKYVGLVAARAGQTLAAWTFIVSVATNPAYEKIYTDDMGEPPALRSVIQNDLTDPTLSVFASQALTARSWYEVNDIQTTYIFNTAIENVLTGAADSSKALLQAQNSVSALWNSR